MTVAITATGGIGALDVHAESDVTPAKGPITLDVNPQATYEETGDGNGSKESTNIFTITDADGDDVGVDDYIAPGTTITINQSIYTGSNPSEPSQGYSGGIYYFTDGKPDDGFYPHLDEAKRFAASHTVPAITLKGGTYYKIGYISHSKLVSSTDTTLWQYSNIYLYATMDGEVAPTNGSSSTANTGNNSSTHTHSMEWVTIQAPSGTQDGLEAYRCTECGYSPNGQQPVTISAYPYFVKETNKKLEKAALGSTVTVSSRIWSTLPKSTMEILASRPDLTVDLKLYYKNQPYEIVIPAGTTIDTAEDYYGFLKLSELYGTVN